MRSRKLLVSLVLLGLMGAVAPMSPAAAEGPTITGGGSSFAALEIDQWRADVARRPYNLSINYQSLGSTFGRVQYLAGTLNFGASDIPFQPGELSGPRTNFAYVPVSAGGIGFMYNLADGAGRKVTDLKLTRRAACRIFSEPGMRWNDPDIVAHNPRLSGVNREIRPVVRQDGSGTSYVTSQFCIAVAGNVWSAFVNRMKTTNPGALSPQFVAGEPVSGWPTGWGRVTSGLAADGVANAVADPVNGKDAITYNEAGFAKERGLPNASVQNASGRFTAPEEEAVTVALGYASPNSPEDGTFSLNYTGSDPRAYFPSTYSYVIAQTSGFPADRGQVLARFLCYAVTKGQEIAVSLQYARLSSVLVELSLRQIAKIPGFPGLDQCAVAGAAAPPPPPELTSGGGEGGGAEEGGGGAGSGSGSEADGTGAGGDQAAAGPEVGLDGTGCPTTTTTPAPTTSVEPPPTTGAGPTVPTTPATPADATADDACATAADADAGAQGADAALDAAAAAAARSSVLSGREILWLFLQGALLCALLLWVAGLTARKS